MKTRTRILKAIIAMFLMVSMIVPDVILANAGQLHNVTFMYGTQSVTTQVADGGTAIPPANTEVPGYTFVGWVGDASNVTEDRIIMGAYIKNDAVSTPVSQNVPTQNQTNWTKVNGNVSAPAPNVSNLLKGVPGQTCAVHWYNGWTGALIRDDLVPYGSTIGNVPDPTCGGLEFSGWEGSWENITEDRSIKAWYFQVHKVTFVDSLTGAQFNTQMVRNGDDASLPEIPQHGGFHFEYLDGDYQNVTSDRTITVMYDPDYNWHDDPRDLWWLYIDPDNCGNVHEEWWL